ncbi:MAG TPA: phosphatase PAP2 family protein [Thermoanaerobaculia bacterium]|nr:phosphatase PAP2 family protein [Thermoanaerobaculia bacterium]
MSRRSSVRVEDVVSIGLTASLVAFAGLRSALAELRLDDASWWDLSFLLAPVSVLVFLAASSYAWRGNDAAAPSVFLTVGTTLRDWLPFLIFSLTYETFRSRIWALVLVRDRDADLLRLDRVLFGETPSVPLQGLVTPLLTNAMSVFYFLHLVAPPVLAFILYRRDRRLFREFLFAILLSGVIGSIGYLAVPATGPAVAFPELYDVPLRGDVFDPISRILETARAPRDVFPSLHVGVSAIVLAYAFRRGRALGLLLLPFVLGNWISTVYLRYHYLIDVFAGFAAAALAIGLSARLPRLEDPLPRPPPGAGSFGPGPGSG